MGKLSDNKRKFLDRLSLFVVTAARRQKTLRFLGLPISPRLMDAPLPDLLDFADLIYEGRIIAAQEMLIRKELAS